MTEGSDQALLEVSEQNNDNGTSLLFTPSSEPSGDIIYAVEKGQIDQLKELYDGGRWKPEHSGALLRLADNAGTLMTLMTAFQMPLWKWPDMASMYEKTVEAWFRSAWKHGFENPSSQEPTPQANMMANFLKVPGPIAENLMNYIVEDMAVLPSGAVEQGFSNFPEELGAIYIKRLIRDEEMKGVVYQPYFQQLKIIPQQTEFLKTSKEISLTLDMAARRDALIPGKAKKFAFVYPGPGLPLSGFIYVDGDGKPCAINSLDFTHQPFAFHFGEPESISERDVRELAKKACKTTADQLQDRGAKKFVWINPNEGFPDGLNGGPGGGFAYLFDDPKMSRFFPLEGASEVVDHATLQWEVNTALMDFHVKAEEVEQQLTFTNKHDGLSVEGVRVIIARMRVPDVLHPVVLHALMYCTRDKVLSTPAAKAIASATFSESWIWALVETIMELLSLGALCWFTRTVREGDLSEPWGNFRILSFCVMSLVWVKDLLVEIVVFACFWRRFGRKEYMHPVLGTLTWSHLVSTALLLVVLTCDLAADQENKFSRPLLGLVGAQKWIVTFWQCRPFQTFDFGLRILPIIKALGEVVSFLFVMLFFFGASYQVSFAFTDQPMSSIIFNTYRMGFTGDMEDELFLTNSTFGEVDYFIEHGAYYLFAFVVMVAMTNIFIGVMGNAFDFHQQKAKQLFVRERISVGFRYALLRQFWFARTDVKWLWFCYPPMDEDRVDQMNLRSSLSHVKEDLSAKLSVVQCKLGEISERLLKLEIQQQEGNRKATS